MIDQKSCDHQCPQEHMFGAQDYISGKRFSIYRCSGCELLLTEVDTHPVGNEDHYPADYYGKESRYSSLVSQLSRALIKFRTRALNLKQVTQKKVLDIGCGQGWLLKHFEQQGWQCQGIEVSEHAAYHARHVLGLDILDDENAIQNLDQGQFDVICLWHVLEHVKDPSTMLDQIKKLLADNGQLLLGVPNAGSLEARLGKDGWFHLDVPRHLTHFTEKTLSELLSKANLEISKRSFFVPEYDFFSFVQTVQNRMGLPMNLLYKILRKGHMDTSSENNIGPTQRLAVLLSLPILGLASLIYVPTMILFGQGSSLVLIVKKKK